MGEPIFLPNTACQHLFRRDGWQRWESILPRSKWKCIKCGLETRLYDKIDRSMNRPAHRLMSVALIGYNTIRE